MYLPFVSQLSVRPWSSRWRLTVISDKNSKSSKLKLSLSLFLFFRHVSSPNMLLLFAPLCSISICFVSFCFPPWRPKNYDELHQATALSARWLPSCVATPFASHQILPNHHTPAHSTAASHLLTHHTTLFAWNSQRKLVFSSIKMIHKKYSNYINIF